MTAQGSIEAAPRVTLDEIKHRVESVRSLAVSEAKSTVNEVLPPDTMRTFAIVAGLVVVAASLAFFIGARSGRAQMVDDLLGE